MTDNTATDCERIGHCWHGGTAVGAYYCCRCGAYSNPVYKFLFNSVGEVTYKETINEKDNQDS